MVAVETALFVLRVISPSLILLTTISLLTTRPTPPPSPSPITAVTVAARIPRRGVILSCLSFSSFIYLLDGLVFVVYAVIDKYWPQRTGIEINALIGLVAFAGLAALGSWKDVQGVDVWLLRRMKIFIFLSLVLDIAQVVLYGILMPKPSTSSCTSRFFPSGAQPIALTDYPHPYPFPYAIQALLHFILPILRLLVLVLLFFALANPVVTYTKVTSADDAVEDPPMSTTPLLSSSHDYASHQSGRGLTVRDNTYGACDNGTYTPTTDGAGSLQGAEDASDRIKVCPRTIFSCVNTHTVSADSS
jgi:hypothetical protein